MKRKMLKRVISSILTVVIAVTTNIVVFADETSSKNAFGDIAGNSFDVTSETSWGGADSAGKVDGTYLQYQTGENGYIRVKTQAGMQYVRYNDVAFGENAANAISFTYMSGSVSSNPTVYVWDVTGSAEL